MTHDAKDADPRTALRRVQSRQILHPALFSSMKEDTPGNHDLEHRIRSVIRWNAVAIILRANNRAGLRCAIAGPSGSGSRRIRLRELRRVLSRLPRVVRFSA